MMKSSKKNLEINMLYNIFLLILLLVLLLIKPDHKSLMDSKNLLIYSLFFLSAIFLHFYKYSKIYKNWFRLDVFFILGFGIVHFQWPIMYSISGVSPLFSHRIWVDEMYVNYSAWLSAIGAISWLLGYSIIKSRSYLNKQINYFKINKLRNFTILLFVIFLITAGKSFFTGGVYKGDGGSSYGEGFSAYIQILYSISIILLTTIIILNNKNNNKNNLLKWFLKFDKKFLILYFTYIVLFLLIGDRGGPIYLIITTIILIGSIVRPFKLRTLLFGVIIGGFVLSIISFGRSEESGIGILGAGLEKFTFSSGYDNTLELANSVRTLHIAAIDVPENHEFFYGKLWTSDILSPIPFAQSLYLNLTNDKIYELGSAGYITYLTSGPNATSGEGTSLIADVYLNFGVFGVLFFMFLLGVFFKKANNNLNVLSNMNWIIIAAILASYSIYFGRASFFIILRPVVWSFILMKIFIISHKFVK